MEKERRVHCLLENSPIAMYISPNQTKRRKQKTELNPKRTSSRRREKNPKKNLSKYLTLRTLDKWLTSNLIKNPVL